MKESHDQGSVSQVDPESCVSDCKVAGEALTVAHTGQVSSCEITQSGTPTPLCEAEGNITGGADGEPQVSPAQSQTLKQGPALRGMCGNSLHGNRETPRPPAEDGESAGRSEIRIECSEFKVAHMPDTSCVAYVYEEELTDSGEPPVLKTQYIQKWAVGIVPSAKIKVTVTAETL